MSKLNYDENDYRWVKNGRIYTFENSEGKVLRTAEDRTCDGNFITDSILEDLAAECFGNEKGSRKYENGTACSRFRITC